MTAVYGMNTYTTNLVKQLPGEPALDDFRGNVEFTFTGPNGNPPNLGYQAESVWLQTGKFLGEVMGLVLTSLQSHGASESCSTGYMIAITVQSTLQRTASPSRAKTISQSKMLSTILRESSTSRATSTPCCKPSRRTRSMFKVISAGACSSRSISLEKSAHLTVAI